MQGVYNVYIYLNQTQGWLVVFPGKNPVQRLLAGVSYLNQTQGWLVVFPGKDPVQRLFDSHPLLKTSTYFLLVGLACQTM